MSPVFLLREQVIRECGEGSPVVLDGPHEGAIRLTLDITRILPYENLDVAILGSPDGNQWKRIAAFPHKSYCGTYSLTLDPPQHRDARYLKASWSVDRWSTGAPDPLFCFSLTAEEAVSRAVSAG
jgi:hypothetical protein